LFKYGSLLLVDGTPAIDWYITPNCNNNCFFCNYHDESKKTLSLERLIKVSKWIKDNFKGGVVSIIGGEPGLIKELGVIMNELKDFKVLLNTNLNYKIESILNCTYNCTIHIPESNLKLVELNLSKIIESGNELNIKIMFNVDYNEIIESLYHKYVDLGINVSIDSILFKDYPKYTFKKSQDNRYVKANEPCSRNLLIEAAVEKNPYYGFSCAAGVNSVYIDYNADVYPCCTYKILRLKPMGNILANNVKFKQNNTCTLKNCFDFNVLKTSESYHDFC